MIGLLQINSTQSTSRPQPPSVMVTNGEEDETVPPPSGQLCHRFSLDEIQLATHNFHEELVIGRGGFGKVYKGVISHGGTTVAAIKRLDSKSASGQGAREFWSEVEILSQLRHCHLVSLIGYCDERQEMILVYEYVPNGTLYDRLHKKIGTPLSWIQRLKICIGSARGLDYLHTGTSTEHRIIHRDVKSTNILVDENWAAKISDFGLSKVGPKDHAYSSVSTTVKGSFGYFDPEYFYTGKLTRKSDVYSFGIVLLEVLCGRPAVHSNPDGEPQNLARWAQECIGEGNLDQIIDSRLAEKILPDCLKQFAGIVIQCLDSSSNKRPTMAEIVFRLENILALQTTDIPTDEGEKFNIYVHGYDNQVNMESCEEQEVSSFGDGYPDEWILGDASRQSYIKPANKVIVSKTFDNHQKPIISASKGKIDDFSGDIDGQKSMGSCAEHEVMDADAFSGSGSHGGYEDDTIFGQISGGKSNVKPAEKITFMGKVKQFFSVLDGLNSDHLDANPSRDSEHITMSMLPIEDRVDLPEVLAGGQTSTQQLKIFTYTELARATINFKLMEYEAGGERMVYTGWVDDRTYAPTRVGVGMTITVRVDYEVHFDGLLEEKLDLKFIGECSHPNLAKLLGYCLENGQLFRVYEFMQNGSLERHLFSKLGTKPVPWVRRLQIAEGAARGLAFLHKWKQVRYSQFSTSVVWLDGDFNAKLVDFELAKSGVAEDTTLSGINPVYSPPEWYKYKLDELDGNLESALHNGDYFTVKSEVYPFGVVLLEILTGRRAYDATRPGGEQYLVEWALPLLPHRTNLKKLVDPRLLNGYSAKRAFQLAQLILKCLQTVEENRPSMEEVLLSLTATKGKTK